MMGQHENVESFYQCECESPVCDPVRYDFPGGESIEMVGCLDCGGLVEWELEVDYSVDEITPDELPEAGKCRTYDCDDCADVVVQLRRDFGSITAYCDDCWDSRTERAEYRWGHEREVLARVVDDA